MFDKHEIFWCWCFPLFRYKFCCFVKFFFIPIWKPISSNRTKKTFLLSCTIWLTRKFMLFFPFLPWTFFFVVKLSFIPIWKTISTIHFLMNFRPREGGEVFQYLMYTEIFCCFFPLKFLLFCIYGSYLYNNINIILSKLI